MDRHTFSPVQGVQDPVAMINFNLASKSVTSAWAKISELSKKLAVVLKPAIIGGYSADDIRYYGGDLAAAVGAIGSESKTLFITMPVSVSANLIIPTNISIHVIKGGSFAISTGVTLTINGSFEAGIYQVFSGLGSVAGLRVWRPEWWGAVADDSTTSTTAFQRCLDAMPTGGVLLCSATTGHYLCGSLTRSGSYILIKGLGGGWASNATKGIRYTGTTGDLFSMTGESIIFEDLVIDGNETTGNVIDFTNGNRCIVRRCTLRNGTSGSGPWNGTGVSFSGAVGAPENAVHDCILRNFDISIDGSTGDGFIERNIIVNASTSWIRLTEATGWHINLNKIYNTAGTLTTGVDLRNCGYTQFVNNELEISGATTGVYMNLAAAVGNVFAGNTMFYEDTGGPTYLLYDADSVNNNLLISGNSFNVGAAAVGAIGIEYQGSNAVNGYIAPDNAWNARFISSHTPIDASVSMSYSVLTRGSIPFIDAIRGTLQENNANLYFDPTNIAFCVGGNSPPTGFRGYVRHSTADCNFQFKSDKADGIVGVHLENDARRWTLQCRDTDIFAIRDGTAGALRLEIDTSGHVKVTGGNLIVDTAGMGIRLKEGSNARMGVSTLVAGTVTVSNTSVTANTRILLTVQSLGTVAVPQAVYPSARVPGTSFTITSADATDTSVVLWELKEPA